MVRHIPVTYIDTSKSELDTILESSDSDIIKKIQIRGLMYKLYRKSLDGEDIIERGDIFRAEVEKL